MEEKKKGFFSRRVEGLHEDPEIKTLYPEWIHIFSASTAIDDDFYEELEETLIMGDMRNPDDLMAGH